MPTLSQFRMALPDWPRLMSHDLAARYLSISVTSLREHGPKPKRRGRSVLYDRSDLDRWADRLGDQPQSQSAVELESAEVERQFLLRRRRA